MKILLIASIVTMTLSTYSQSYQIVSDKKRTVINTADSTEMTEGTDHSVIKIDTSLPDGIMLYGTKMVIVKNGIMKVMEKEVVFPNGTRVRPDGQVFRKNKPKLLLNFGEYIDTSGNILPMENLNSFTN